MKGKKGCGIAVLILVGAVVLCRLAGMFVPDEDVQGSDDLFDRSAYQEIAFSSARQWQFRWIELYKHYFITINRQLKDITTTNGSERYSQLQRQLSQALTRFSALQQRGIYLYNNTSDHIGPWMTAAHQYAHYKGWV